MRHNTIRDLFNDIAAALQAKLGDQAKIKADNFDEAILDIPQEGIFSDDVTAYKEHVLSGRTTVMRDSGNNVVNGEMTDRGAWIGAVPTNGNILIPKGYHDGSGYVSNVTPTQAGGNVLPSFGGNVTAFGAGKLSESAVVIPQLIASGLVPENILSGKTVNITCNGQVIKIVSGTGSSGYKYKKKTNLSTSSTALFSYIQNTTSGMSGTFPCYEITDHQMTPLTVVVRWSGNANQFVGTWTAESPAYFVISTPGNLFCFALDSICKADSSLIRFPKLPDQYVSGNATVEIFGT